MPLSRQENEENTRKTHTHNLTGSYGWRIIVIVGHSLEIILAVSFLNLKIPEVHNLVIPGTNDTKRLSRMGDLSEKYLLQY